MAAKYWLKLYYDILDDPKIGTLRAAVRWRFVECLLVAGECDDNGYIPDVQEYAWRVRADASMASTTRAAASPSSPVTRGVRSRATQSMKCSMAAVQTPEGFPSTSTIPRTSGNACPRAV